MTVDLACLVANALFGLALVLLEIMGKTRKLGPEWNAGNRDGELPELPPWIDRTSRALQNHKENFPLFATAVVVVHLAGKQSGASAAACVVYAVARAGHGATYVAGVTKIRTLFYLVGLGATLFVFSRLAF